MLEEFNPMLVHSSDICQEHGFMPLVTGTFIIEDEAPANQFLTHLALHNSY